MKKTILTLSTFLFYLATYSQNWAPVGQGLKGRVYTLFSDIATNILYAGGVFDSSGTTKLNRIGSWDGIQWNNLGEGFNNTVYGIAIYNGELYATGVFTQSDTTTLNHIAKWNGTNWVNVGAGLNDIGFSLFSFNGDLYAGGRFTMAGNQTAKGIAKWDGTNWQYVDTNLVAVPIVGMYVKAIGSFQNKLVIGGSFVASGTANNIAILDSGTWHPLSTGVNSFVTSLVEANNELFVTGYFSQAGSVGSICIARWNGTSWLPFPSPASSLMKCSTFINNNFIVGSDGYTFQNQPLSSRCIASYSLTNQIWSGITTGMGWDGSVEALATMGNTLYAAGGFDTAGVAPVKNIAKIDATTLSIQNIYSSNEIIVFPNPFIDKIFLKTNGNVIGKLKILITDAWGRETNPEINFNSSVIEIKRASLCNGIYFLKLWDDQKLISETKLIAM